MYDRQELMFHRLRHRIRHRLYRKLSHVEHLGFASEDNVSSCRPTRLDNIRSPGSFVNFRRAHHCPRTKPASPEHNETCDDTRIISNDPGLIRVPKRSPDYLVHTTLTLPSENRQPVDQYTSGGSRSPPRRLAVSLNSAKVLTAYMPWSARMSKHIPHCNRIDPGSLWKNLQAAKGDEPSRCLHRIDS
jgi:hypothetical protein